MELKDSFSAFIDCNKVNKLLYAHAKIFCCCLSSDQKTKDEVEVLSRSGGSEGREEEMA